MPVAPRSPIRRIALMALTLAAVLASLSVCGPSLAAEHRWAAFVATHISGGQVIDDHSGVTHSEGQGYAMLLATVHDDRATFDRVWSFTSSSLRRKDGLFSWRWENGRVTDQNNATDGDILIAWALLRAGERWNASYRDDGLRLVRTIREKLVLDRGGRKLLVPGMAGFSGKNSALVVNPSYWVWPALDAFEKVDSPETWRAVQDAGIDILTRSGAGSWQLVPDWVSWPDMTATGPSTRASYDSLRIPLYLVWAGRSHPATRAFGEFWTGSNRAWTDVATGTVSDYGPGIEQQSVSLLVRRALGDKSAARSDLPATGTATGYYASVIALLAEAAWSDRFPE